MKILITGINGFIGKHLAANLVQRGHFVIGLSRGECSSICSEYIQGDVLDKTMVEKTIKKAAQVDVIVHLAALTSHQDIVDDKYKTLETNINSMRNVLEVFQRFPIKKIIYSSTGKVYGKTLSVPITEEHNPQPLNILGKAKLITERLADFYAEKPIVIFRIFNIYGPGQKDGFLLPTILKQIKLNDTITLGDIKAKRDYTYIDDLIQAFILAIEKEMPLGISTFNICSQKGTNAEEIVRLLEELTGKKINIQINQNLLRSDEMNIEYGSYSKAERILGWKPKYTLKEGLKKTIPHYL